MQYLMAVKSITLMHAIVAAVVMVAVAILVVKGGILNSLLWIAAIAVLVIGAINKVSYG